MSMTIIENIINWGVIFEKGLVSSQGTPGNRLLG